MRLNEIAEEFLKLVSGELDPFTTKKGVVVKENNGASLFTPAHIQFAKYGRGPGKQPPVDPLIEWAKGKGIENPVSAAWAIAKSIAKNGTLNYVAGAPNAIDEAIDDYMADYMSAVSKTFNEEIAEAMRLVQVLPESIKVFKI